MGIGDVSIFKKDTKKYELWKKGRQEMKGTAGGSAPALGVGMHTRDETWEEIRHNVRAVGACYYDEGAEPPAVIRLHFVRDEVLAP